jgi:hypothetical protein
VNSVVVSTFRRPWQTRLCLESIIRAQRWLAWADRIAICINPAGEREVALTVQEIISAPSSRTLPVEIWVEPGTPGGPAMNAHDASKWMLDHAFNSRSKGHNDICLYVEDDAILSPDAFTLLAWYQWAIDRGRIDRVAAFCLYSETIPAHRAVPPDPAVLHLTNGINTCGGTAFLREPYETVFSPHWNMKQCEPRGFDFSIHYLMYRHELYALYPDLSRSHNVGFFGGGLSMEHWLAHFQRSIWTGEHNGIRNIEELRLKDIPPGRILEEWMRDELRREGIQYLQSRVVRE